MRIIAGTMRGRQLVSVRNLSIRPTTDRAKQTIFDILTNRIDFRGIRVLDLFAGSGSLGLEAISRGAKNATFVENSRNSIEVLKKNIRSLTCEDRCEVAQADVFWYLKHTTRRFDLVFADPPYKLDAIGSIPTAVAQSSVLAANGYLVMEHSRESVIDLTETQYDILQKPFGQTTVLILRVPARPLSPARTTPARTTESGEQSGGGWLIPASTTPPKDTA
ncbi:MAG: 16S rRNA (guanine(966)-N(2))-methyltransferase RsmD [Ignavibacteriales bacterium]|nr:16S rRNA (guanine(966)-N(2))-methyltransferase RsmD [Ignavibacteriales bacterium]